jgi:NarL family two-component system response regulator LiaR
MSNARRIRILIVDDHDMLREGLSAFLRAYRDLELVGDAANGEEALRLCHDLQPDVVLMDLVMPDMDGVAATKAIHQLLPHIKIIALSSFGDNELVQNALAAGATSYLLKNIPADKLAEAIRTTYAGLPTFAPEVTRGLLAGRGRETAVSPTSLLTPREQEVLDLLVDGLANAEIAQRLKLSIFTVKNHVSSILAKFNVSSRTEAVSLALKAK